MGLESGVTRVFLARTNAAADKATCVMLSSENTVRDSFVDNGSLVSSCRAVVLQRDRNVTPQVESDAS